MGEAGRRDYHQPTGHLLSPGTRGNLAPQTPLPTESLPRLLGHAPHPPLVLGFLPCTPQLRLGQDLRAPG